MGIPSYFVRENLERRGKGEKRKDDFYDRKRRARTVMDHAHSSRGRSGGGRGLLQRF